MSLVSAQAHDAFGYALDRLSEGVVMADASGRIVYANSAAERLFGWPSGGLRGEPLSVLVPPRLHARLRRLLEHSVGQGLVGGPPLRISGLRRDGTLLRVALSLCALPGLDGSGFFVAEFRSLGQRVDSGRGDSGRRVVEDGLAFLVEAGALLDESLDYAVTLQRVVRLAVPRLADYCLVDIIGADGMIRRVATAHRDPAKEPLLHMTEEQALAHGDHPAMQALRTGGPILVEGITEATWARTAHDEDHLHVIRALAPHAWLFLPLTVQARSLGTMAFVLSEPGRSFSAGDQALARELARRAALAMENARLYTAERTQRERLYSIFTQAPAAIAILRGSDLRYELSNPVNQELTGGRALEGRTAREALPELEAMGAMELIEGVYRSGKPYVGKEAAFTMPTATGERTFFLNFSFNPLRSADGTVEGVMLFCYDVTEQVHSRQKVEAAERLFRTLAQQIPVGLFLTSPEGNCEYVNPRWCELAGMSAEQAAGRGWVNAVHPDDRDRLFQEWYAAAEAGRSFESRYRFRTPEGRVSWLEGAAVPVRAPGGSVTAYIGTVTDVTERRKAEAEREQLMTDLRQAVRLRDDFLSIASHELRTPLTTLRLHMDLLRGRSNQHPADISADGLRGKLEKMERQLVRLDDLIDTLLDVSRITQGRLELRTGEVDLSELAHEVTNRFSEELEAAGCAVRLLAGSAVVGHWDRGRLDQVLTNLLTNAMKYGKGKPVEMAVSAVADHATFSIADHGIGIPVGDRERIFERFERTVSAREHAGLGLGLWIAREIVHAHGGSIRVEDTAGGGVTFTVNIPRQLS